MNQELPVMDGSLLAIRPGRDTQTRVAMDVAAVPDYAEAMLAGATFPPIVSQNNRRISHRQRRSTIGRS